MKEKMITVVMIVVSAFAASAQVPQKFNYQAVVRNAQHAVIAEQDVGFRLSILEGSPEGSPVYTETHTVRTNLVGLAELQVGSGTVVLGEFDALPWGEHTYYLKVELDAAGGNNFKHMGTSQLISVPYSLYSANVSSPTRKFVIQEDQGHPPDSALFEVRNVDGQTVFAVYPEGTRIYVLDEPTKARKRGFAIGGYSRRTKGITQEYMHVSPDSVRFYVDEQQYKGVKGGFAVGGYSRTKAATEKYFELSPDNASFTLVSDSPEQLTKNSLVVTNKLKSGGAENQNSLLNLTMANYLIGHRAGESIIDATENCIIGMEAGLKTTSGYGNIFIGQQCGQENTIGNYNTFIGDQSGVNSKVDNGYNTYLGARAGIMQTKGANNVIVGALAGENHLNGFENIFIGTRAAHLKHGGSGNIFIGYEAGYEEEGDNKLIVDNHQSDSTGALIFGDLLNGNLRINHQLGIGRNATVHALEVEGSVSKTEAGTWLVNSDNRIKTQISDIFDAKGLIMQLHPVKFRYTDQWLEKHPSIRDIDHYNFVAQEFQEVFPDFVQAGSDKLSGNDSLLQIDSYPAQIVAIRAIQELIEQNRQQQQVIEELQQKVGALEELVEKR